MKRIGICIDSLEMGGAEKLLVDIIKALYATKKYEIHLLTKNESRTDFYFEIKDLVEYSYLTSLNEKDKNIETGWLKLKQSILKKIRFNKFAKNVDVLIDFLDGDFYKYMKKIKNKEKILWLHLNYKDLVIKKKIDKKIEIYDKVIVITDSMLEELKNKIKNKKIYKVFNMVDFEKINNLLRQEIDALDFEKLKVPYFLSVCRLDEDQKDVTTLIKSFSKYEGEEKLYILGEGKDRKKLELLVKELKIIERVEFLGLKLNPFIYMKNAKALILSSKSEGFGLVIVEALYCGTKVISSNCEYGPSEILLNGKVGEMFEIGNQELLLDKLNIINKKMYSPDDIRKSLVRFDKVSITKEIERILEC